MDLGIEFTTFSLIGRCERTGMLGVAIATSEMAVGSRCIHVAPGVGAVVCQASTNPRLGFLGRFAKVAAHRFPAVTRKIPGIFQSDLRMRLNAVGGAPQPKSLIFAGIVAEQPDSTLGQIKTILVHLHGALAIGEAAQQRITSASLCDFHDRVADLQCAHAPDSTTESSRDQLRA